jgi:hypothetical protein
MRDGGGLHTYIGCSIRAGGSLRVISYINPQASKFVQPGRRDGVGVRDTGRQAGSGKGVEESCLK